MYKKDLQQFHLLVGETPHSFKYGGVTNDLIKMDRSLKEVMYKSYLQKSLNSKKLRKRIECYVFKLIQLGSRRHSKRSSLWQWDLDEKNQIMESFQKK